MASEINVPFKVDDRPYTNDQVKAKDAATLVALQEIAQGLASLNSNLAELTSKLNNKK